MCASVCCFFSLVGEGLRDLRRKVQRHAGKGSLKIRVVFRGIFDHTYNLIIT